MLSKLGTCSKCSKQRYIVNRKHMMCDVCNKERLGSQNAIPSYSKSRYAIKPKRKPTGEKALFMAIWETRPHVCQVSGEYLGEEPDARFFSHLLSKGAFPKFRLYEKNIWLVAPEIHHQWEFVAHSDLPAIFEGKLKMKDELKREYYQG